MFSFVDIRLALLLSATVLLVRGQGEDDSKYQFLNFEMFFWDPQEVESLSKDAEQSAGSCFRSERDLTAVSM